jgi:hypothetical protein
MMWVRSTAASHGFVFVRCRFEAPAGGNPGPLLARNTAAYPNSEVVLIECALGDINPAAWSLVGDTTNQRYWEYHSVRIGDGRPADVSGRHPASRQLTLERDAGIIANYSNPAYVLGGWSPSMAPVILTHPAAVSVSPGGAATFSVGVAAVPAPTYRWRRNGTPVSDGNGVSGATTATLTLADAKARDRGTYTVAVTNAAGTAISAGAALQVR